MNHFAAWRGFALYVYGASLLYTIISLPRLCDCHLDEKSSTGYTCKHKHSHSDYNLSVALQKWKTLRTFFGRPFVLIEKWKMLLHFCLLSNELKDEYKIFMPIIVTHFSKIFKWEFFSMYYLLKLNFLIFRSIKSKNPCIEIYKKIA